MDSGAGIVWSPFSAEYFKNPYPHLSSCRKENPIQKVYEDSYFFFRYEDVASILKEKDFKVHSLSEYLKEKEDYIFKNVENACPHLASSTQLWPMYLNNDIHKIVRRAITKAFYANPLEKIVLESLEETQLAYENVSDFDLVDYCGNFICFFIKKVLNINEDQYLKLKRFSNLLAKSQDLYVPKQVYQEINAEIISQKHIFQNSIFKDIILEETKGLQIDEEQMYSIMLISFMASFETSKDNLSLGIYEILKSPQLIDHTLNTDAKGIKVLIEEILRFTNPLQFTIRINNRPLTIGDYTIPINSKLYLSIASANRDETVFENPDEIDENRLHNPHLAFGAGTHQCLGAPIARQEMELCLKPMLRFLKDYQIEEVKWSKQIFMRTVERIMIRKK